MVINGLLRDTKYNNNAIGNKVIFNKLVRLVKNDSNQEISGSYKLLILILIICESYCQTILQDLCK